MLFAFLIGVMTICFFINLGFIKPDVNAMVKGMVVPSIPEGSEIAVIYSNLKYIPYIIIIKKF